VIFATVGTQLPFDRLVGAVDRWAAARSDREVFGQVGPTALRPAAIAWERFLSPQECRERMRAADLIVAHAGMGTILTALELGTPIVVMPRVAALGEHRNDHQLATARRLAEQASLAVAFDEAELHARLDALAGGGPAARRRRIGRHAEGPLVDALRAFIAGGAT
jgi:UDP-N-acetylglucosamine transferase subunit ALG13